MDILLIILGFVAAVVGFFSLSQATEGVGFLAVACFLGILARIAQASKHQGEIEDILDELKADKDVKPA